MIKIVARKCLVGKCILHQKRMADQAAFKGMGGKRKEFMLKWVPNPKEFRRKKMALLIA